jgi:hypothetical protein
LRGEHCKSAAGNNQLGVKLEASVECRESRQTICGHAAKFDTPSPTQSGESDRLVKETGRYNDHGQHAYADEQKICSIHTIGEPNRSGHYQE